MLDYCDFTWLNTEENLYTAICTSWKKETIDKNAFHRSGFCQVYKTSIKSA